MAKLLILVNHTELRVGHSGCATAVQILQHRVGASGSYFLERGMKEDWEESQFPLVVRAQLPVIQKFIAKTGNEFVQAHGPVDGVDYVEWLETSQERLVRLAGKPTNLPSYAEMEADPIQSARRMLGVV